MIDIRKLKELVRLMVSNELTELDLRDSEEQVTLRRNSPNQTPQIVTAPVSAQPVGAPSSGTTAVAEPPPRAGGHDDDGLTRVESPMVGTFYAASDPDAAPFVSVGSSVGPDDTVCIIEAMKIFNEIKAECSGTIRKVMVKNGEAVEFGQPLFLVEPA
jgi:acetyl-CoA carboxylase biotin carboxyl carrier protein